MCQGQDSNLHLVFVSLLKYRYQYPIAQENSVYQFRHPDKAPGRLLTWTDFTSATRAGEVKAAFYACLKPYPNVITIFFISKLWPKKNKSKIIDIIFAY